LENPSLPSKVTESIPEPLTSREIEVLRLIAQGYTNNRAAEILNISVRTVEYHRSNLTAKLNLHSRVDLMRYAEENHLI
jgi:two-component system response regulator NreC